MAAAGHPPAERRSVRAAARDFAFSFFPSVKQNKHIFSVCSNNGNQ